ncbi:MAG: YybH family protein, partial [Pirellulaceae bacterium]
LAGSWQASRDDVSLEINCRWVDNNQFLERTHTITRAGEVISTGRQIMGVDPATGMIGSWSFNSDGSRSRGVWTPHEQGWYVESVGFMADGTPTAATYTLTIKDDNTLLWESDGRMVGSADLPDTAEITLSRK